MRAKAIRYILGFATFLTAFFLLEAPAKADNSGNFEITVTASVNPTTIAIGQSATGSASASISGANSMGDAELNGVTTGAATFSIVSVTGTSTSDTAPSATINSNGSKLTVTTGATTTPDVYTVTVQASYSFTDATGVADKPSNTKTFTVSVLGCSIYVTPNAGIGIPRDSISTGTVACKLYINNGGELTPYPNQNLSVSDPGSHFVTKLDGATDSNGNATLIINSNSISSNNVTDTITVSYGNASASFQAIAYGIQIVSLTASRSKIYQQSVSNSQNATKITASIQDTNGDAAKGSIDFVDSAGGSFSATNVAIGSGNATTTLQTGIANQTSSVNDTITASIHGSSPSISANINVEFLYAQKFVVTSMLSAVGFGKTQTLNWYLLDTDNNYFPAAPVQFQYSSQAGTVNPINESSPISGYTTSTTGALNSSGSAWAQLWVTGDSSVTTAQLEFTVLKP